MTSQEAKKQIVDCDRDITNEYSKLQNAARHMGASAVQAAASRVSKRTLMPMLISLFGFILCLVSSLGWGITFIVLGTIISYASHSATISVQRSIENNQKTLISQLERSAQI